MKNARQIALTGTFAVERKILEQMLTDAGHKVGDLSGKTEILLVGEKTASESKVKKAQDMYIWILSETNPQTIHDRLAETDERGYIDHYARKNEVEFVASSSQARSVFSDFVDWNGNAGEWFGDDAEQYLKMLSENPGRLFSDLQQLLGVQVEETDKRTFFRVFYRLVYLDSLSQEGNAASYVKEQTLRSEDFYRNRKALLQELEKFVEDEINDADASADEFVPSAESLLADEETENCLVEELKNSEASLSAILAWMDSPSKENVLMFLQGIDKKTKIYGYGEAGEETGFLLETQEGVKLKIELLLEEEGAAGMEEGYPDYNELCVFDQIGKLIFSIRKGDEDYQKFIDLVNFWMTLAEYE